MNEMTGEDLKQKAHEFIDAGKKWHAHFFTPECKLNQTGRYLTLLECPEESFLGVCFHDEADKALIGYLAPLLHGVSIEGDGDKSDAGELDELSEDAQAILVRARGLNSKGIDWHHHVLFADCKFNKNQPNWTLVIEDPEADEVLESISDHEPKEVLKFLEPLFYSK